MKKTSIGLLLSMIAMLLLIAACAPVQTSAPASAPAAEETGLLGEIQERGKIVFGTSADYPPYESIDASGNFVGFDMDLARAVGEKLGVEVEIQDMPFDTLIAAVQEGKIDAVIAAMQATAERDEMVDFSVPYRMTKDAFLAAGDSTLTMEKSEDAAGKSIGAQTGTVQERWLQEKLVADGLTAADQVFSYERADQGALDVANGRIELLLLDAEPAMELAKNSGLKVLLITESTAEGGKSIAIQNDEPALKAAIDAIVEGLIADGTVQKIQEANGLP